jgi:hypothetical protein
MYHKALLYSVHLLQWLRCVTIATVSMHTGNTSIDLQLTVSLQLLLSLMLITGLP